MEVHDKPLRCLPFQVSAAIKYGHCSGQVSHCPHTASRGVGLRLGPVGDYKLALSCDLADVPKPGAQTRERIALTIDELDALLDASTGIVRTLVELSGRNGLRPAEARALRWEDLDLREGLLSVTGQMNRDNDRADVKRVNNASRTIHLHASTPDHLQRLERSSSGLVVVTRTGTSPNRHNIGRDLGKACVMKTFNDYAYARQYDTAYTKSNCASIGIRHKYDPVWSSNNYWTR